MSRLVELAQKLVKLEAETTFVKAELVAALSANAKAKAVAAPKKAATRKKAAKPAADATNAPQEDKPKRVSLKDVVQTILGKSSEGLDLGGIVAEVHEMVKRGEYATNAKSLSAVVSQAVNQLKQEVKIKHDRESKKYSLAN
jgi:hypothetical protein